LKVLASVSTLAIGLALSGAAFATTADDNNLGLGNASDGSIAGSNNHNTSGSTVDSQNGGNTHTSTHTSSNGTNTGAGDASNGGKNIASNNSNSGNSSDSSTHSSSAGTNTGYGDASNGGTNLASNNSLSLDNNNNQSRNTDKSKGNISGNGDASNGGEVKDSNNSDTSSHGNNSGTGDASNGGKVIASNNSNSGNDSSTHTKTTNVALTVTVSNEDLQGSVSGVFIAAGDSHHGNGQSSTGLINGDTYSGFAGIQTSSQNTGIASLNQAATSIAANANVSFGSVH